MNNEKERMSKEARLTKPEDVGRSGLSCVPDLLSSPRPPRLRGSHLLRSLRLRGACILPFAPTGKLLLASPFPKLRFHFAALRFFAPSRSTLLSCPLHAAAARRCESKIRNPKCLVYFSS